MLTCTTDQKLLTILKIPKKKMEKQKDEWNKSPDVSDDEDPWLQSKKVYKNLKRLQAAIASAIKSGIMHHLTDLLSFPLSPIYKLEVHTHIDAVNDLLLPTDVNDFWIECVAPDQPLGNCTYHGTHYCYLLNTILSILQVDGR
uniref:Uncharacterized protein n=1 Tax=Romanomermis culicivorax TaxID=13658 RepID=A0A915I028_ROMCU